MLKVDKIYKSFDEKQVLEDLTFEVKEGSILGIIGPNGCGKTTLLKCICDVYTADKGTILFNDKPVSDINVKKDFLYITDEMNVQDKYTLEELKNYYAIFYDLNEEVFEKMCKEFELNPKTKIGKYSKGMKKQAMMTIALAISPKVILLDEIFDGLDSVMKLKVKRLLSKTMFDNGTIIVLSSHNLKEIEEICDQFLMMEKTKILHSGDLNEQLSQLHKFQLAFNEEIDLAIFDDLKPVSINAEGKLITIVLEGNEEELYDKLNALHPAFIQHTYVNLEEFFLIEMNKKGYGDLYDKETDC